MQTIFHNIKNENGPRLQIMPVGQKDLVSWYEHPDQQALSAAFFKVLGETMDQKPSASQSIAEFNKLYGPTLAEKACVDPRNAFEQFQPLIAGPQIILNHSKIRSSVAQLKSSQTARTLGKETLERVDQIRNQARADSVELFRAYNPNLCAAIANLSKNEAQAALIYSLTGWPAGLSVAKEKDLAFQNKVKHWLAQPEQTDLWEKLKIELGRQYQAPMVTDHFILGKAAQAYTHDLKPAVKAGR